MTLLLAMDRATVRRTDMFGHFHVGKSNMSKANVCGYLGCEIPGYEELGLDASRVYQMLRDPEEIAKGIETLNGKPVLLQHKLTTAEDHQHDLTVGSTGTNAAFDGTYATNSMSLWARRAIDGVRFNRQREISAGYSYKPDMTPGEYEGLPYDGKMKDIVFNHVALVIKGRAGPDVLVGDEDMLKSRTAERISGAVAAIIRPKLADGAKVDITTALGTVTAKSIAMDGAPLELAGKIVELVKPYLAQDEELKEEDVAATIEAVPPAPEKEDGIPGEKQPNPPAPKKGDPPANPTTPAADPADAGTAMDEATVHTMIADAVAKEGARRDAIDTAKRAVQPFVGEVTGDTAASIYKLALDARGVDLKDVPESAYAAILANLPAEKIPAPVAMDAAHSGDFAKRFPEAVSVKRVY